MSEDFAQWYQDVVREAELADHGPVRGTMVIRPYGYAIWENLQSTLNAKLSEAGHSNCYFPQLIPVSFLEKEKDHVAGFSPELALVTQAGGKELDSPLALRPTSETVINASMARWIRSYRDLPLLLNQWANVTRWELRPRPFLRTSEFLWQEGHTAHSTARQAEDHATWALGAYADVARGAAGLAVVPGRKSRRESFAGAEYTLTIEAMMRDGRALQAGTSHYLGTRFAQAFDTRFLDRAGRSQLVHQTSFGMSTRMVGGVVMGHGDDWGLRLPPRLAPVQVAVVALAPRAAAGAEAAERVLRRAREFAELLKKQGGMRVAMDEDVQTGPGRRFGSVELRGVPLRVDVGLREVDAGVATAVRRDRDGPERVVEGIRLDGEGVGMLADLLVQVQDSLLRQAEEFRDSRIVDVETYEQLKDVVDQGKWARGYWEGSDDDERRVQEDTTATLRCFPFDQPGGVGRCFYTNKPAKQVALFAKAY